MSNENEELSTMVAKAVEILNAVRSRLAGDDLQQRFLAASKGGKHAPAPVGEATPSATTFRQIRIAFWDVGEKRDEKTGDVRRYVKVRSTGDEDFWINDEALVMQYDPQERGACFHVTAVPARKDGQPVKNKRGMGVFRVVTMEPALRPKKDGDPGSAFDAAHEIPF